MGNSPLSRLLGLQLQEHERRVTALLPETELDVLCYLDRHSLESYQLVSRRKRTFVDHHRCSLPLRKIASCSVMRCRKEEPPFTCRCPCGADKGVCIYAGDGRTFHTSSKSTKKRASEQVALRLRNSFIDTFGIYCNNSCLVLEYLCTEGQLAWSNCRAKRLRLICYEAPSAKIISFLVDHLHIATLELLISPERMSNPDWLKNALKKAEALVIYTSNDYLLSQSFSEILSWRFAHLQSIIVVISNVDLGPFINDYIQSDASKHFVRTFQLQSRVIQHAQVTPAPLPSLCTSPVETTLTTKQVFEKGLRMQDAACAQYTFENHRRRETLHVFVASVAFDPSLKCLDGSPYLGHCHAYSLCLC